MKSKNLQFTGERLTTNLDAVYGVTEHLHRYALAQQLVHNKIVLDIASGEGYGSNLLAQTAKKVIGVDIDFESVTHATEKYNSKNVSFQQGSTSAIPLDDHSVDVVVSFETLEHHDQHEQMMQEISRVLKSDGILLISSPEKSIYAERDPNNPFHIKELNLDEFKNLLDTYFSNTLLFQQQFVVGSLITLLDDTILTQFKTFDGNFETIQNGLKPQQFYNKPYFNLAICTNAAINLQHLLGNSLFNGYAVLENQFKNEAEKLAVATSKFEYIANSYSYKFGYGIVSKFNFIKKLWNKK